MKTKKNKRERSEQMREVSAGLQDVLGMTQWRKEHPKATWQEIEAAIDERINQLRAQMIEDVVQMDASSDWSQKPQEQRPRCASCDQPLSARGVQTRLPPNEWRGSSQADANVWNLPKVGSGLFSPG